MQKRILLIILILILFTILGWYLISTADRVVPPQPELHGILDDPEADKTE